MHPSKDKLRLFVEQDMKDSGDSDQIAGHVRQCEFCAEFCEEYRLYLESIEEFRGADLPVSAINSANSLLGSAVRGLTVAMHPLADDSESSLRLAADGKSDFEPEVVSIATHCSENPEAVLRIMRDNVRKVEYLHLISDDPALAGHVMIQAPEVGWEFVTDLEGRADIEQKADIDLSKLNWQIKMPDALFSLQPFVYDPDETTEIDTVELTTRDADRISVELHCKREGKQIVIRILELDGKTDFGDVRVFVSQGTESAELKASRDKMVAFELSDSDSEIDIRLFR